MTVMGVVKIQKSRDLILINTTAVSSHVIWRHPIAERYGTETTKIRL